MVTLQAQALATPLGNLVTFLRFTGHGAEWKPLQEALCKALVDDSKLPAEQSRLIRNARCTKEHNLRGFVHGMRAIPEAAALSTIVERDAVCATVLCIQIEALSSAFTDMILPTQFIPDLSKLDPVSSAPLWLQSPLEERIEVGIERVKVNAWASVVAGSAAEDRFRSARQHASTIIAGLSPHIRRQVGAYFETRKWEPLKACDPCA